MRRFEPSSAIPADARGASVVLGNFDGVHLGHQAVIASARSVAATTGANLGAVVFEPHPRRYFRPESPPFRLQSPRQRARALGEAGVADIFELEFDAQIASLSARAFAERLLHESLGVAHVSVGSDFCFGAGREGSATTLAQLGVEFGFSVAAISPLGDGKKISSSDIREAVASGDMRTAAELLTRPFAVEGEVLQGFARGRDFGFPTANIALGEYVRPRLGIYAVRADLGDGVLLPGVASVGVNPTVGALPEPLLETHLLDFSGDLYGRAIEVELIAFLRDEIKFDSIETLKNQMRQDAIDARRALIEA